ncbi:MAG: hypothetical protein ACPLZG_13100 [Thermoproteota archaeon]|jgi:hypothetical protein
MAKIPKILLIVALVYLFFLMLSFVLWDVGTRFSLPILSTAGLVLFVLLLFILVGASPSIEEISRILREEEPIWKLEEKSEPLVSGESVTAKPRYSEWSNEWYDTYNYWLSSSHIIYGNAENIVIRWSAVEKSSKIFNFYVFDEKNFDFWKEGTSSTAYYIGKGSSTYSFTLNFSKKEELPSHFYYVVEVPKGELNPKASEEELKRVVEVNAVASWTISGF